MQTYDQILTAKSWIVMDYKANTYMRGNNWEKKRQFASLAKMYTLYSCLKINKLLNIIPQKIYIKIFDITTTGTVAQLKTGKFIKIQDLYYAMMLPSGNDAASLLAYYYGYWLDQEKTFSNFTFTKLKKIDIEDRKKHCNLYIKKFIHYSNETIIKKQLGHKITNLQNPHGLANKFQVSTAWQLAQASIYFMKNSKIFRKIVNTKKYKGFYLDENDEENLNGQAFQWINTNILLSQQGFQGIKTGHTITAGNCLASYKSVEIKNKYDYQFVVVVLGCQTLEQRFSQTKIICDGLQKHLTQILY